MSKKLLFTRREFVATSISVLAGAILPAGVQARLLPDAGYDDAIKKMLSVFNHAESMKFIGRKYIEQVPAEQKESTLMEAILSGGPGAQFQHSMLSSQKEIKRFIRSRVKQDFISGQTVNIQGWVLAKTEARLCALAFLDSYSTTMD
jgi:hypothetical protein